MGSGIRLFYERSGICEPVDAALIREMVSGAQLNDRYGEQKKGDMGEKFPLPCHLKTLLAFKGMDHRSVSSSWHAPLGRQVNR